ncbi:mitochondrial inner membrane protein OXA1 [Rhypophila sp. PSN 637]
MLQSRGLFRSNPALGLARIKSIPAPRASLPIPVCQFSTALRIKSAPRLAAPRSSLSSVRTGGAFALAATSQSLLSSRLQARYASTQPEAAPAAAPVTGAEIPEVANDFGASIDLSGSDLINMPETIGFLKQFGLDYGWGPTAMMEWYVEHIYVWTGMPWWATILTACVGIRLAIFKPSLDALVQQQKMNDLKKNARYEELDSEMKTKMAVEGLAAAAPYQAEMTLIRKAAGIKMWKTLIPMVNIPISYGMFRLFRGMAGLPVPSLENGGVLWFQDLTVADPFFIMPVLTAAIIYKGMMVAVPYMGAAQQKTIKLMGMVLLPLSLIFTINLSAATQLYFFLSAALHALQSMLFYQPWFRAIFALGPVPTPGSGPAGQPNTVTYQPPRVIDTTVTPVKDDSYSATISSSFKSAKETVSTTFKERTSSADKKAAALRAKEYEEKRALEEKEKLIARREYRQMKRERR